MFPQVDIVRWRAVAPWADDDDVEQDLVITLALFDIFRDESLKQALAFRGGTALHKLHLPPAARYSEDIDLVQQEPGPIGPVLSRLRRVLEWIGPARSDTGEHPRVTFRFETETGVTRKVKVEINSHEHFGHVVPRLYAVPDLPVGNSAVIPTYELDELLATKLRALYQRRKGRDLFDLGGHTSRRIRIRPGSSRSLGSTCSEKPVSGHPATLPGPEVLPRPPGSPTRRTPGPKAASQRRAFAAAVSVNV